MSHIGGLSSTDDLLDAGFNFDYVTVKPFTVGLAGVL